jgi:hypothetical protein
MVSRWAKNGGVKNRATTVTARPTSTPRIAPPPWLAIVTFDMGATGSSSGGS